MKLPLLPSPFKWDVDTGVNLTRNTINAIIIHTHLYKDFGEVCNKDMRGTYNIHLQKTGKEVFSRQNIVTVKWFT